MAGKAGDRVIVESEQVGQATREGEILEVIQGEISVMYHVRWSDGHESVFTPSVGSARVVPAEAPAARPSRRRVGKARSS